MGNRRAGDVQRCEGRHDTGGFLVIIAGSRQRIQEIAERMGYPAMTIRPTTFSEIRTGLRRGEAYCFDEQAYGRFLDPARRAGIPVWEEDFSDPGPVGLHFVRVQIVT